jgi:acetyl esterase/lipase
MRTSRLTAAAFMLGVAAPAAAGPVEDLDAWLRLDRNSRPALETQAFASTPLSAAESEAARALIKAERTAWVKAEWGSQWTAKRLQIGSFSMPFDFRIYGNKPAAGYDFYISMHGGGEAAASVNDQQWQNQIGLYRPPGIYLAPRAPTNTWNMWFQDHIDGFFDRLIQLATAYQDANPNRVYVMGYSAGGDGAYQLAPRMADRWAAGAMMAGHPNDASPVNLRNIGFTLHVGALDAAFERNTIAVEYGKKIQQLQDADPGFYKYHVQVHAGKGHWMDLQDTVALSWMAPFTRKPHPKKVVWLQDKARIQSQFHWIALPGGSVAPGGSSAAAPARITAEIEGQEVHVEAANLDSVAILLNDQLVDLNKPVAFFWNGVKVGEGGVTRTAANLYRSSEARGDGEFVFPARVMVGAGRAGVSLRDEAAGGGFHLQREAGRFRLSFGGERRSGSAWVAGLTGRIHARVDFSGREEVLLSAEGLAPGVNVITVRTEGGNFTRRLMAD